MIAAAYSPSVRLGSRVGSNAHAWVDHYAIARSYTANGLNQYTASGSITPTYDANGNLTADGTNSFTYDAENRLVSASGAHNASLAYDPLGRLWQVTSGSSTTRFLWDGDALVVEYDGSGNLLRRHVYSPEAAAPVISYEGSGLSSPRFPFTDERGSVVALADGSGAALAINSYDEYGIPASTNTGRFQYAGQVWLAELGMSYNRARLYSPSLGRFLQTDPIGFAGGMNIYAYTGNDPVNFTDPSGLTHYTDEGCTATRICVHSDGSGGGGVTSPFGVGQSGFSIDGPGARDDGEKTTQWTLVDQYGRFWGYKDISSSIYSGPSGWFMNASGPGYLQNPLVLVRPESVMDLVGKIESRHAGEDVSWSSFYSTFRTPAHINSLVQYAITHAIPAPGRYPGTMVYISIWTEPVGTDIANANMPTNIYTLVVRDTLLRTEAGVRYMDAVTMHPGAPFGH